MDPLDTKNAKYIENSLLVGRPLNLALMAARIVAGSDPAVQKKLTEFRKTEAAKYDPHVKMELKHFKGGE